MALTNSGSQADIVSSQVAHKTGEINNQLIAPLNADLGAEGHEVRLAFYINLPFKSGDTVLGSSSYFVHPLPKGIDTILGLPWMHNTGAAVTSNSVILCPDGAHRPMVNVTQRRFDPLQPVQNFKDLGFVNRPMTEDKSHCFAICMIMADHPQVDEFIDFEWHNPLLDIEDDDPSKLDLSEDACAQALEALILEFNNILVSQLPSDRAPPFQPVNHEIPLIDPLAHI